MAKGEKKAKKGQSASGDVNSTFASFKAVAKGAVYFVIAMVLGYFHRWHVSTMYENDRHFSHLSNLEREMGFRTEMGLYYSYYKTVATADSLSHGFDQLIRNNVTEYPDTINVLKRFNLYPELFLGVMFRAYEQTAAKFGWQIKECYNIERGQGLTDVESCEGLGDMTFFYLEGVWLCAALVFVILFLIGAHLGDGILGGVLAVLGFIYNHGECTRVQWTPPLRESFAYPVSLLQIYALTIILQRSPTQISWLKATFLTVTTACYIITWQFAQFALFTQWFAVCILYSFRLIDKIVFNVIFTSLLIGLSIAVVLMFGNEMLFSSWLFCCLVASIVVFLVMEPITLAIFSTNVKDTQRRPSVVFSAVKLVLVTVLTVLAKQGAGVVLNIQDDAHIANILRAKFTSYRDFHTMLYTCAKEFDFLGWEMPMKTTQTLLLPSALVGLVLVVLKELHRIFDLRSVMSISYPMHKDNAAATSKSENESIDPVVAYHSLQTVAFAFLAGIIMRLKLLFTPQLCVLSALLCNCKYIPVIKERAVYYSILALLIAGMSVQGITNINKQRSVVGEYSNLAMEELIEWIKTELPDDGTASLAGPMPVMANLLLSTNRPVVNHPHYEDAGLRERTRKIYKMYDRISAGEYHATLKDLNVKYLVVVSHWCFSSGAPSGCSMVDIWSVENPPKEGEPLKPTLCPQLFNLKKNADSPFKKVFSNNEYVVLKV